MRSIYIVLIQTLEKETKEYLDKTNFHALKNSPYARAYAFI